MADQSDEIAQLEAALSLPGLPEAARRQLEIRLGDLRAQGSNITIGNTTGRDLNQAAINLSDDVHIAGGVVGVNLGTIVYGRAPAEDERRTLVHYLARLANRLRHLPLRGLDPQLDEQGASIALGKVYVELSVKQLTIPLFPLRGTPTVPIPTESPPLATEIVAQHQQAILLSDPGSGKSTFLRHLAWVLAQRGLGQPSEETTLHGWDDTQTCIPVLIPMRKLAANLAAHAAGEAQVLAVIRSEIESIGITQVDSLLSESLHRGAVMLLFDGLDEVPPDATPTTTDRATTLRAVRDFARMHHRARLVVTCRTRAFDEQLSICTGWPVATLAPFTLDQVRHFVSAWYGELVAAGQLAPPQDAQLRTALADAIGGSARLREMAQTPLLLTMMALVLYRAGSLPRDRPLLYERILELLLGQWDKLRDGQSLAEAIGQAEWDSRRLRSLLDELSYQAHAAANSADGRGRLSRGALRDALIGFFEAARLPQPWEAARRCLEYFDQRSGLLAPDDDDSYVFAHLTLQEHCAGCAMLRAIDAPTRVLLHRADDRWREPLLLGLGAVQANNPALLERILSDLIDPDEAGQPKPAARHQRDLILAAEIGQDRDWNYMRTQQINVDRLRRDLRRGLVALLDDRPQPLPMAERVRAGFLLGDLGDPRFPVTLEQWQHELARVRAGDPSGYFCRVEAGTYTVGSDTGYQRERPQRTVTFERPFWIARFPITVAQAQGWRDTGVGMPRGLKLSMLSRPNQPLVNLSWQLCGALCSWLSQQIGATVRLPSEQEWEAAARGTDARRYPWGNEWDDQRAATEENIAQRSGSGQVGVPVGCFAAGMSACGAHDMAGNVWEWTAEHWHSYPNAPEAFGQPYRHAVRGGSYLADHTWARCAARDFRRGTSNLYDVGLRVVLEDQ